MAIRSLSTASISTGAKRSKFWDQSAVILSSAYESIQTVVGNGSSTTLTFSSIPQTYKHLQIRVTARNLRSGSNADTFQLYFNSDTSLSSPFNYTRHAMRTTSSTSVPIVYSVVQQSGENIGIGVLSSNNTNADAMGISIVDILDYTDTNKFKTVKAIGGYNSNGSTGDQIDYLSSLWNSTSAITSITMINNGSAAYASDSQFALYGIKG